MLLDVIDRNKEDVNTSCNDEILGNPYMESNGAFYGWYGLDIIYSIYLDHRTDLVDELLT